MAVLSMVERAEPRRVSIRLVSKRLEESPLYQRRELDAKIAQAAAQLNALWYTSPKFEPRWQS